MLSHMHTHTHSNLHPDSGFYGAVTVLLAVDSS